MEKKKKVFIFLSIVCLLLVIILYFYNNKNNDANIVLNDIEIFINDYEGYNNKNVDGVEFYNLNLNDDAIIYITDPEKIVEIMETENTLVYFGFASCRWCRSMVSVLLDAAVSKNQEIYYVDISEIRDLYDVSNNEVYQEYEGTASYYQILEFFGDNLNDYVVYDNDENSYETGITRMYAPTVATVKNGAINEVFSSTSSYVSDPYEELNEEEYDLLFNIFVEMIDDMKNLSCSIEGC